MDEPVRDYLKEMVERGDDQAKILLADDAQDVTLADLCDILSHFQIKHGLNGVGAEELLASDSTPDEHKPFLTAFMVIWEEFA